MSGGHINDGDRKKCIQFAFRMDTDKKESLKLSSLILRRIELF